MNKKSSQSSHTAQRRQVIWSILRFWWVGAIALGLWAISQLYDKMVENPPVQLELVKDTRIDMTPEAINSIRDIGQWEFLSVSTEEMVEWHQTSALGDKHLVRIYHGTLRLGIDMDRCSQDWFTSLEDSAAILKLPALDLLDTNFIDEAKTRSLYEKGTFSSTVYDEMYRKADLAMRHRCMTPQNIRIAQENACEHFTRIFKAFGFKTIDIHFSPVN